MRNFAPAAAAFVFPGVVVFGVALLALRRQRPPVFLRTAGAFVGLGLLAVVLGEIWSLAADRWWLGRVGFGFYYAFVTAAIPEEVFRFLAICYGLRSRPHVRLSGAMLLGGLVGLTFATYEHVLYALSKGWGTWLARSFTSVPYHVLSGAILGYAALMLVRTRRPSSLVWLAVLIVIHGAGDWPLDDPERPEPDGMLETFFVSGWAGNVAMLVVAAVLAAALAGRAKQAETGRIEPPVPASPH